jgi:hypothetical protein
MTIFVVSTTRPPQVTLRMRDREPYILRSHREVWDLIVQLHEAIKVFGTDRTGTHTDG